MSDDDDVGVTGGRTRRSSLVKKGRNRIRTLADSSDDEKELFADSSEEEESEPVEEADFSFSPENLKRAMGQLKGCMDPSPEFSSDLKTWQDVQDLILQKNLTLRELEKLVKYLNKEDSNSLSLEFKCLVTGVARNTCVRAKFLKDVKKAQELFKGKGEKTNHVANFVSNLWVRDSMKQLESLPLRSFEGIENNMHAILLRLTMQFMADSFVIDNEKKLTVLKEKQAIDWEGASRKLFTFGMAKKANYLAHAAAIAKKYFGDLRSPPSLEASIPAATASATSTTAINTSVVDSISLEDMAKKKREERMKSLRRKAYNATGLAGGTSASASPSVLSSSVQRNSFSAASTSSSANARRPSGVTNNYSSISSSQQKPSNNWGGAETSKKSSAWGDIPAQAPNTSLPPKSASSWGDAPAPPNGSSHRGDNTTSAPAPSRSSNWGDAPATATATGRSSAWGDAPAPAAPAPGQNQSSSWGDGPSRSSTWGNTPAAAANLSAASWGGSLTPGRSSARVDSPAPAPAPASSISSNWRDAPTPSHNIPNRSSRGDAPRKDQGETSAARGGPDYGTQQRQDWGSSSQPSSVMVGDSGSADASSRSWGNNNIVPGAAANTTGSAAHDNQTDVGWDRSNRGDENHSSGRQQQPSGGSSFNKRTHDGSSEREAYSNRNNGNKRPRQDTPPQPRNNEALGGGGGGGGMGRGRGRTLPAWMTQQQQDNNNRPPGDNGPSSSSGDTTAPPKSDPPRGGRFNDPPRNAPPPPGDKPAGLQGTGRGRDRTLPAWMTKPQQSSNGPQGQQHAPVRSQPEDIGAPPTHAPSSNIPSRATGFHEPSRDAPVALQGTGRGRGRTLPAWMTQQASGGPGG